MKKLGVVLAATAGLLIVGGPAFADPIYEDHAAPQIGLVNLQGIDIAKDLNIGVNAGVCGIQGVAVPVLSPILFDDCVSHSGIDDD